MWQQTACVGVVLTCALAAARADDAADLARAEYQKGLGAFGLAHYVEAAGHYERAFALKPDPALLYNAAQSQRLAGNVRRALLLYENYLRLFPNETRNRAEVNRHIVELRQAIRSEERARTSPPHTTVPLATPAGATEPARPVATRERVPAPVATEPPAARAPSPPVPAPSPPAPEATPPPPEPSATAPLRPLPAAAIGVAAAPAPRPLTRRAWFWVTIGAGTLVLAGVAVGLGVGLGSHAPTPSYGVATVR